MLLHNYHLLLKQLKRLNQVSGIHVFVAIITLLTVFLAYGTYSSSKVDKFAAVFSNTRPNSLIEFFTNEKPVSQTIIVNSGVIEDIYLRMATYANLKLDCAVTITLTSSTGNESVSKDCSEIIDNAYNKFSITPVFVEDNDELSFTIETTGDDNNPIALYYDSTQTENTILVGNTQTTGSLTVGLGRNEVVNPSNTIFMILTACYLFLIIFFLLFSKYLLLKINHIKLLFFIGFMGILYIVIVPPFHFSDEHEHFMRVVELSQFDFLSAKYGSFQTDERFVHTINNTLWSDDYLAGGVFNETMTELRNGFHENVEEKSNAVSLASGYMPFSHAPHAFVMAVLRIFHIPALVSLYIMRITTLFIFITLGAIAIRLAPQYKYYWLTVLTLPSVLSQASAVSIDGLVIGMMMVAMASIVTKSHSSKVTSIVLINAFMLAVAKYVFFPVSIISIWMFFSNKLNVHYRLILTTIFAMFTIITSALWLLTSVSNTKDPRFPDSNPRAQLQFILSNPVQTSLNFSSVLFGSISYSLENAVASIRTNYRTSNFSHLLFSQTMIFILVIIFHQSSNRSFLSSNKSYVILLGSISILGGHFLMLQLYASSYGNYNMYIPHRYITTILPTLIAFSSFFSTSSNINHEVKLTKLFLASIFLTLSSIYSQAILFTNMWN